MADVTELPAPPAPVWRIDDVLAARPRVRVDQFGQHPAATKRAVLVTDRPRAVPFAVHDARGRVVEAGTTVPWPGVDPSSGMRVHTLDLTALRPGTGLRVVTAEGFSHPFDVRADSYPELAADALRFLTYQRSGWAIRDPDDPRHDRPAGHLDVPPNRGDRRVPAWTGPDAERWYPGWHCPGEFDVSGGWYDAGDHGKYVTGAGVALAQLLAARDLAPEGAFGAAVEAECRWELDWFLRMQVPAGLPHAGLAFHRVHGVRWQPEVVRPHRDPTPRVLHRPSTAAGLHLAATCAQAARAFRGRDDAYAARLLAAARRGYAAARAEPDLSAPDDGGANGGGPYGEAAVEDEFYWAAGELFLATGEPRYREDVLASPFHHGDAFDVDGYDWDTPAAFTRIRLATTPSDLGDAERERVAASVVDAADRMIAVQREQPWGQPYAPRAGWDWGSVGRILNNLTVLLAAHRLAGAERHLDAARFGLGFVGGRNALGQCFVTGYGLDDSRHQRTRHYAADRDPSFPPPPRGAVAGGPNSRHYPGFPADPESAGLPDQLRYRDVPTSETTNDVCIRWNAALVLVATGLLTADATG